MKTIYTVDWNTKKIRTATLLDESNLNPGATVESWLCKDEQGRRFTCSRFSYQFSELGAWQEYWAELEEHCKGVLADILELQKTHGELLDEQLKIKQKIVDLVGQKMKESS